jgi:protein SCO1
VNGIARGNLRGNLLACGAMAALLTHLLATATGGFEHWTFESLRREQAARGRLQAPDVELVDSSGQAWRPWSRQAAGEARPGRGDVVIVDFVFTRCVTVCQSLGTAFQQMQAQLPAVDAEPEDAPRVRLMSISFDPGRDSTADLQAYGLRHRSDPLRWTVAVPAGQPDTQALLRALGVVVIPDGWGGYAHNAGLHVIDGNGRLAGIYDLDAWPQALADARTLALEDRRQR